MIRDENARLNGHVYVDITGRDAGSSVEDSEADRLKYKTSAGIYSHMERPYEKMPRVRERLIVVVSITLFIIFILICSNTRSAAKTLIIFPAVPFSAVGAVRLLYLLAATWASLCGAG